MMPLLRRDAAVHWSIHARIHDRLAAVPTLTVGIMRICLSESTNAMSS